MKYFNSRIFIYVTIIALLLISEKKADAQKVEFGLRFMPTVSKFDVKTSSGSKISGEANFGFGMGAFLGFNFSEHIGVQGEIIYSSASQKYKDADAERKISLKYINMPLLLSLNTNKSKAINLNIVAGPQIGINVGSSLRVSGGDVTTNSAGVLSVKKGDLGFAYGAGVDFGLNSSRKLRLGLGYRGVFGMFDISDNSKTLATDRFYVLDRSHIKSHAAYIGLSLLF